MTPSTTTDPDPAREVRRLHLFLQDWFGGVRDTVSPMADALAESFRYVGSDGTVRDRDGMIDALESEAGTYADSDPPFVIDVVAVDEPTSVYATHMVTFECHRRIEGEWEGRRASAWLIESEDAPTGLKWLHLHETTMPAEDVHRR